LGAAVAAVVAARDERVRGVVLEAGFTAYRRITGIMMRRSIVLWPFSFLFPPLFVRDGNAPIRHVAEISPRPLFLIHGDADKVIPSWMSEKMFERAGEPKSLWIVPGAGHLGCRASAGKEYEDRVSDFFTGVFAPAGDQKK
jgi:fermentation-respiration switch protein FrsA (DUF1100 family)